MKRIFTPILAVLLPISLLWGCGGGSSTSVTPPPVGQSSSMKLSGELDVASPPPTINTYVYDSLSHPHSLKITLANPIHGRPIPAAAGVPANATQRWDVQMYVDGQAQSIQQLYAVPTGSGGNTFVFTDPNAASPASVLGSALPVQVAGSSGASAFNLHVDFSGLKADSKLTATADGKGSSNPAQTTQLNLNGNLNLDGANPIVTTGTIYDKNGNAFSVTTTFSNPTYAPAAAANVPAGARQQWDIRIQVDTIPPSGSVTVYDSSVLANNESKVYYVPGSGFVTADGTNPAHSLGSTIQLTGGSFPAGSYNQGLQTATNFSFTISLSHLTTSAVSSSVTSLGNGQ